MFRKLLVPVTGDPADEHSLNTAFDLARLFGGHVEALHARPDARIVPALYGESMSPTLIERTLREAEQAAALAADLARRLFNEARAASGVDLASGPPGRGGPSAAWRDVTGPAESIVATQARLADLTVLAGAGGTAQSLVEAALFGSGRPLLRTPAAHSTDFGGVSAIAWDGGLTASRAVASALPLLRQGQAVVILSVDQDVEKQASGDPARLADYLAWHGIPARTVPVARGRRSVGEALAAETAEQGAEMLVMGGYGHSRMREMVLGGVTRHMLAHSLPFSILMAH